MVFICKGLEAFGCEWNVDADVERDARMVVAESLGGICALINDLLLGL